MKQWLVLMVLLSLCSGCALLDEPDFGPPVYGRMQSPPVWATQGPAGPPNGCGVPVNTMSPSQTAEPELLPGR